MTCVGPCRDFHHYHYVEQAIKFSADIFGGRFCNDDDERWEDDKRRRHVDERRRNDDRQGQSDEGRHDEIK